MEEPDRQRGWHHGWQGSPHDGWRPDRNDERAQRFATHVQRWQRGSGEPLKREPGDRLLGGVAAGVARWRGFNSTTVRIAFIIVTLISQGTAIPFYFIAWLLIPPRDEKAAAPTGECGSIWSRARHDSRGIALAVGVASLLCVVMLLAGALNDTLIETWGWPQIASAACLVLIWRNAEASEQARLSRFVEPLGGLGAAGGRRGTRIRVALGCVLIVAGTGWFLTAHETLALLAPLAGAVLIIGGLVLLLGPWWLRIARDLVLERAARARAEERADIAARVHDSVLQTLALIQRRADEPAEVVKLARLQERELRAWLFEGRTPGAVGDAVTVAEGIRQIQQDAESRHGVPVEVVTVGDCPLNDDLHALLEAAREAVVNAAKWSGAGVISLYAEVTAEDVEMVVRDRGKGFDPSAVSADRKGMAESIHGRMNRHGGTVAVQTAVGEGTKVSLTMPRGEVRAGSAS